MIGILGKKDMLDVKELEVILQKMSSKPVKTQVKEQVKFEFKEKGKKQSI